MAYAGFLRRALALIIDLPLSSLLGFISAICVVTLVAAIGLIFGAHMSPDGPAVRYIGLLVDALSLGIYFAGAESSRWQATPGKRLLGLRVTGLDGERIRFPRALRRVLFKLLSWFPYGVGFFRVLVADNRQAFHDKLAGTLVLLRDARVSK